MPLPWQAFWLDQTILPEERHVDDNTAANFGVYESQPHQHIGPEDDSCRNKKYFAHLYSWDDPFYNATHSFCLKHIGLLRIGIAYAAL
jgi:hypothetical protein